MAAITDSAVSILPLMEQWELLGSLHPAGLGGTFVLLKGYIDESVNKEMSLLTLCALVARGEEWKLLTEEWGAMLAYKNAGLTARNRKPISRYHASDCNALQGEFRGWNTEEQKALTTAMLEIFNHHPTKGIACSIDLGALQSVLPEGKDLIGSGYAVTSIYLIDLIGRWLSQKEAGEDVRAALVVDRGPYAGVMGNQFNSLMRDARFAHRRYFTTLAPMGWEDCTPLQTADLMAYESMKFADGFKRRYTFGQMLKDGATGIIGSYICREHLEAKAAAIATLDLPNAKSKPDSPTDIICGE